ncbi:unnamed protein product [Linum trigynum]|uniref:Uncharacterized protein n=1 Tax=Linum trigynum TaxID=586398 RepID=A0AAV2FDY5_9ROSI
METIPHSPPRTPPLRLSPSSVGAQSITTTVAAAAKNQVPLLSLPASPSTNREKSAPTPTSSTTGPTSPISCWNKKIQISFVLLRLAFPHHLCSFLLPQFQLFPVYRLFTDSQLFNRLVKFDPWRKRLSTLFSAAKKRDGRRE